MIEWGIIYSIYLLDFSIGIKNCPFRWLKIAQSISFNQLTWTHHKQCKNVEYCCIVYLTHEVRPLRAVGAIKCKLSVGTMLYILLNTL